MKTTKIMYWTHKTRKNSWYTVNSGGWPKVIINVIHITVQGQQFLFISNIRTKSVTKSKKLFRKDCVLFYKGEQKGSKGHNYLDSIQWYCTAYHCCYFIKRMTWIFHITNFFFSLICWTVRSWFRRNLWRLEKIKR